MLNYEDFKNELMQLVEEEVENRGMDNISFKFGEIESPDGMTDRMIVSVGDSKMSMAFRLKEIFKDYENGEDLEQTVDSICNTIKENIAVIKAKEQDIKTFITDYDMVKDSLYLRMVPGSSPILNSAPHKRYGDMAVITNVNIDSMSNSNGRSCIAVTTQLMEMYGIDQDQLFADAEKNSIEKEPIVLTPLGNMLEALMPGEFPNPADAGVTAYVATNTSGFQGAAIAAYPGFADKAFNALGGDFWVIPSSVHEFILIKDDGCRKPEDLEAMIRDVNENDLSPRDYLSDTLYHFSEKTLSLETGITRETIKTYESSKSVNTDIDTDVDDDIEP